MSDNPVLTARSRLAVASRSICGTPPDPQVVAEAQRDLRVAMLERHVREVVAAAPPLTSDQRQRLAVMLLGGERA